MNLRTKTQSLRFPYLIYALYSQAGMVNHRESLNRVPTQPILKIATFVATKARAEANIRKLVKQMQGMDKDQSDQEDDSTEQEEASTSTSQFDQLQAQVVEIKEQVEAHQKETKETLNAIQDLLGEFI